MTNYLSLDIKTIHEKMKNKEITPLDLVLESFEKIEKSSLNAFITLNKEAAIEEAKRLNEIEPDHLFFGMPIAIKDNIITKDIKTTCASFMLESFVPNYDATVIQKLKQHHMIIIGKTNLDEFAMGSTTETSFFKPTHNPWDHAKVPGGSSGGNAAAVSSGIVRLSLGSDTGGSIRQPSSFCGIVGLKPTYGRVSRYGLVPFASSLDQIGPMTKTVTENALLLNIISGMDDCDLTSSDQSVPDFTHLIGKDVTGLKIGIPTYYMNEAIDPKVKETVLQVIDLLKQKGVTVEEVEIPYLEYAIPLYQVIALGEASGNLARFDGIRYGHTTKDSTSLDQLYEKSRTEGFGKEVMRRIMIGSYVLSGENADFYYKKALMVRKALTTEFEKVFEKYDLLIGPTNTDVAYDLGTFLDDALKSFYDDLLTIPVNMAGLPAMSLPIGFKNGLPIGMHIIAKHFSEDKIYQLAYEIERTLNLDTTPKEGEKC